MSEQSDRRPIPLAEATASWMKDSDFRAAYDALEDEFSLAGAILKARADADMTQEQLAAAMDTSQAFVARLEGGALPSTRTLQKLAKATGTRLRISFEPSEHGLTI